MKTRACFKYFFHGRSTFITKCGKTSRIVLYTLSPMVKRSLFLSQTDMYSFYIPHINSYFLFFSSDYTRIVCTLVTLYLDLYRSSDAKIFIIKLVK